MRRTTAGPALAALAGAQFLVVLGNSIVNVALPQIRDGAGLGDGGTTWVVNAYGLVFGALLLAGGRAADLAGHRRVLLGGLAVFGGASAAAGLASSAGLLIAARAVQGAGAAAIAPAALAVVTGLFPSGPGRGRALGVWGAVSGAGGAAGVLLGGLLAQAWGWRALFFAVAVGSLAVLAAVAVSAPRSAAPGTGRFDLLGTVTVTASLTALVWGLTTARAQGWTAPRVLGALAAAAVFGVLFVLAERRHPDPLVPPRLLRGGRVGAGNLLMGLFGSVWLALFFFLPLYQQEVLGQGPLLAGLGQLPLAGAVMLGSALSPRITARIGASRALLAGLLVEAAGLAWLGRIGAGGSYLTDVLPPSVLVGLGLSVAFTRLTDLSTDGVARADSGAAGGLVNTTRQVGGAIGLAVLATLAGSVTAGSSAPHLQALTDGYRAAFTASAAVLLATAVLAAHLTRPTELTRPTALTPSTDLTRPTERNPEMRTIDETAPVIVRLSTTIDAPIERVWAVHTGIDAWPTWNGDIDTASLSGPVEPGSSFRWTTHGLDITSTVFEVVPGERIVWGGPAGGIDGVHVWTFTADGGRVTVRTEESWAGAPVEAAAEQLGRALHASLESWLAALKTRAEQPA
ncbi:MFS transporter [Actinomadura logoneensis]|uniref:MFS transporter n=1 Tax=Actinomadura logoneensis TaxID=2293572 RepID=A0A372JJI3_9ACTN|nr:MFS transporter [Actinomadura logoneensis]RFU40175.1 MFS transporter [Actinomadura logoneensis]